MPALIYLDSQDYSRLTDQRAASEESVALLTFLRKTSAEGIAQFPFSNLHVQEAVHDEASSAQLALGRARLMKELSHGRVLIPFEHVITDEVVSAAAEIGFDLRTSKGVETILRGDPTWWPWEQLDHEGPFNAIAYARQQVDGGELASFANRKARRNLAKGRARLKANLDSFVQAQLPSLMAWLTANFPPASGGAIDKELVGRLLRGEVDQSQFLQQVMAAALDVESFVSWTVDCMAGGREVSSYIKLSGYRLTSHITDLLQRIPPADHKLSDPQHVAELERIRMEGLANVTTKMRQGLVKLGLSVALKRSGNTSLSSTIDPTVVEILGSGKSELMPGIDLVCAGFKAWLTLVSAPSKTRQKVLRSDALDILHSVYLPYVTFFRTDVRFANVLKLTRTPHLSKVVADATTLPSLIDEWNAGQ